MARSTVLVSNDDGVDSPFLPLLVEALAAHFTVQIAVPARENSWIGRAMTRRGDVTWHETAIAGHAAFAIDGTPTDCVNIALGHLLTAKPDLVVSGINIGYNTTVPLLYSSGTVAAALEGASWNLPAVAASQQLPPGLFRNISARAEPLRADAAATVRAAAAATAAFAANLIAKTATNPELEVHNLNFPFPFAGGELRPVKPARVLRGPLFAPEGERAFRFAYQEGQPTAADHATDLTALQSGHANHAVLNFARLGHV